MTKPETARAIVSYLKDNINGVTIEANYLAKYAPKGFYTLDANGSILVWYNSSPQFIDLTTRDEAFKPRGTSLYLERQQYVISVGLRKFTQPDELDELVETVMNYLINYDLDGIDPFMPVQISENSVDGNEVHWRQIIIETRQEVKIAVHTY